MNIQVSKFRRYTWFLPLLALLLVAPIRAQESAVPPPPPPAEAASASQSALAGFLKGKFTVLYGKLETVYDPKTKGLSALKLKEKVRFRSDQFNLDCEILTLNSASSKLTALGLPVRIASAGEGGFDAKCQTMEYHPNEGMFILTGNPAFRTKGANSMIMTGQKITLIVKDGKTEIIIDRGKEPGLITSENDPEAARKSVIDIKNFNILDAKATPTPKPATKPVPLGAKKKTPAPSRKAAVSR